MVDLSTGEPGWGSAAPVEREACNIGARNIGRHSPRIEGRSLKLDGIPTTDPFRIRDDLDISFLAGSNIEIGHLPKIRAGGFHRDRIMPRGNVAVESAAQLSLANNPAIDTDRRDPLPRIRLVVAVTPYPSLASGDRWDGGRGRCLCVAAGTGCTQVSN